MTPHDWCLTLYLCLFLQQVVKHAHVLNLLKVSSASKILTKSIARALPFKIVKCSLFHKDPRLRLSALQSLPSLLFTYDHRPFSSIHYLKNEIELWKSALPYSCKCSDKDYISTITQTMNSFLHRISEIEATDHNTDSSILVDFVNDFILNDLFMKQSAYPGTVSDKEKWALETIDCVISFASQKQTTLSKEKSRSAKNEHRKLLPEQNNSGKLIMANIMSDDIFAALLSLMSSMWDNTRSTAYTVIMDVLEYAKNNSIMLPRILMNDRSRELFQARAIHLASSPRQREADTGSRMISILCASISGSFEQFQYVGYISNLCLERLSMMESFLGLLQEQNDDRLCNKELPLAHGLLQSLRLIVERLNINKMPDSVDVYRIFITICFQAIEISLIVVADIKENSEELRPDDMQESDTSSKIRKAKQNSKIPLNVNTGAIGANATFASLKAVNDDEHNLRVLKQRVVMGTWLLIKEGCATLSSTLLTSPELDSHVLSSAGDLLIITLTSLKHQGAAFAAHKALQQTCTVCYRYTSSNEIMQLPSMWAEKILHEISSTEIVRDSTLRRSTGYGLGFLSILRSEQISPKFLFPLVLAKLIRLALPAVTVMEKQLSVFGLSGGEMFVFPRKISSSFPALFVSDEMYEVRPR